jgi:hypothetical protein
MHTHYKGKEEMCQQIVELIQQRIRTVNNTFQLNAIPLKYGASIVHEEANLLEATHLECKEGSVHEEDAVTQRNKAEATSTDPSINYAELTKGDRQWQAHESSRKGRPPLGLGEETPPIIIHYYSL